MTKEFLELVDSGYIVEFMETKDAKYSRFGLTITDSTGTHVLFNDMLKDKIRIVELDEVIVCKVIQVNKPHLHLYALVLNGVSAYGFLKNWEDELEVVFDVEKSPIPLKQIPQKEILHRKTVYVIEQLQEIAHSLKLSKE